MSVAKNINVDGKKQFDFKDKSQCVVLVASPGQGKTNTIKWFLLKHTLDDQVFETGIVFTKVIDKDYDYIDKDHIFEGFQEEILAAYLEELSNIYEKTGRYPRNFVILDDLLGVLQQRNPAFLNFLATHRHYGCSVFLATQYINLGTSTLLREITTIALMWMVKSKNSVEGLFNNYGSDIDSWQDFKKFLQSNTKEKHVALMYDRNEETYYTFKAPDMTSYKIKMTF